MVLFHGYSLQRRWPSWRQCPGMSLRWCVSGRGTARLQAAALLHFLSVRNTFAFYSHLRFLWRRCILLSLVSRQPLRNDVTTSFERQFFLRERLAGTLEVGNFLFRFLPRSPFVALHRWDGSNHGDFFFHTDWRYLQSTKCCWTSH